MGRRVIAGVLAVVLAAAGTAVLVMYVRGAEQRALAGQETVETLVVREAIEEGTPAEEISSMVERQPIPAGVRPDGSVDDLDALEGQVTAVDLVPGEQLVAGRFVDPTAFRAAGQVQVPDGHQVITVELSAERVVGGQVAPGDTVGLIASTNCGIIRESLGSGPGETNESGDEEYPCTAFLLHKVLVTNVQGSAVPDSEDEERDGQPDGTQMVSLAVESGDAVRVAYAQEHTSIWLTNEPEDATEDGPMFQSFFSILNEVEGTGVQE